MKLYSKRICPLILFALILAACRGMPEFINHPEPDILLPDFTSFMQAGCPPDDYGFMRCKPDSPLAAFGCDRIEMPDDLLGGLTPAYPLAMCFFDEIAHWDNPDIVSQVEADGFIYRSGGLSPYYVRYVIVRDGKFQMLNTMADFQAFYAPVDSQAEALSFALASGDYFASYGLAPDRSLRYLVRRVEDTHVTTVDDGYRVHLYHYRFFGCGPHTTSALDVLVTFDGEVKAGTMQGIFEDPKDDTLCID